MVSLGLTNYNGLRKRYEMVATFVNDIIIGHVRLSYLFIPLILWFMGSTREE